MLIDKYRCSVCGKLVEVLHGGAGTLSCCNQEMQLVSTHTKDAVVEKHVPVVSSAQQGIVVEVGSIPHPMTEEHYIEWIEVVTKDERVIRQHLYPGQEPRAIFAIAIERVKAVHEYCNLHGLWTTELE